MAVWFKVNSAGIDGGDGRPRAANDRGRKEPNQTMPEPLMTTESSLPRCRISPITTLDSMMEREHKRCQQPSGEVEWEIDTSEWCGPQVSNIEAESIYGNFMPTDRLDSI